MMKERIGEEKSYGVVTESSTVQCEWCGQYVAVEVTTSMTEEEIRELARETCSCEPAELYQEKKERMEKMEEKIKKLLTEKSNYPAEIETVGKIYEMGKEILEGRIAKVSVTLINGDKVEIAENKKGFIVVKRTEKKESVESV